MVPPRKTPPFERRPAAARAARLLALTLACATLPSRTAHAQSATDSATAESLFNEALALLERKMPAEACPKLEASQRFDPGVGTLLYLADCYQQLGRTASAWATFREAAYMAKDRKDDREPMAVENARNLEIGFAHFHPAHNLYFTFAQAVVFACAGLICKWKLIELGGVRVRKGRNPAKCRVEVRQQDLHRAQ